jgi:hypothetical protein
MKYKKVSLTHNKMTFKTIFQRIQNKASFRTFSYCSEQLKSESQYFSSIKAVLFTNNNSIMLVT